VGGRDFLALGVLAPGELHVESVESVTHPDGLSVCTGEAGGDNRERPCVID
jgi:hypothetical protein